MLKFMHQELREFRSELNTKLNGLSEAIQSLSLQVAARPSICMKHPTIQIPKLPFDTIKDITDFDGQLKESDFMDQMVNELLICSLFFFLLSKYLYNSFLQFVN